LCRPICIPCSFFGSREYAGLLYVVPDPILLVEVNKDEYDEVDEVFEDVEPVPRLTGSVLLNAMSMSPSTSPYGVAASVACGLVEGSIVDKRPS
jgi:hypothetical protein